MTDATPLIEAMLTLAQVKPGPNVRALEIGPGTRAGETTAALADRLGGSVVSISRSTRWIADARTAHADDHRLTFHRQLSLATGWPAGAPYDLLLCWEPMDYVPRAWLAQSVPGGRVLCPIFLEDPLTIGIVRLSVSEDGTPHCPAVATVKPDDVAGGRIGWEIREAVLDCDVDRYWLS